MFGTQKQVEQPAVLPPVPGRDSARPQGPGAVEELLVRWGYGSAGTAFTRSQTLSL